MMKPALRFKEFEGEWVEKKIIDVAPLQRGFDLPNSQLKPGSVPVVCSNGIVAYHNTSKCCAPGLVTGRSGTIGKFTLISEGYYWPHNTSLWVTDFKKNLPVFISYLYQTIQIERYATGSGVPTLNRNDVHEHKCFISIDKAEQAAIGLFFTKLDSLIEGKRLKLDKLKKLKQAYLGKMFPKKGTRVPEIRFKGFTDDWKKVPFGKCMTFLSNNTLSRAELNNTIGLIQNVHYGDILVKFGEVLDLAKETLPFVNSEIDCSKFTSSMLKDCDVVIADTAEDETAGKCTEMRNVGHRKVLAGLHTIPCRPNEKYASCYLGYYMNSPAFHNQLLKYMQGTKVVSISKGALANTFLFYPNDKIEQDKIGSFFRNLDNLINLQQKELDKLANIKSACLSKMFA